jgi:MEDS: MEthanogen/methylotroph, DcmR Sensory domain
MSERPIRVGGAVLGVKRHVCAFFRSPEEKYGVLRPFIKEGFERGEKAFPLVDPELRQDHLRRMEAAGIDTGAAEQSGQLDLRNWAETYLLNGHFDQRRMLALLREVLDGAEQQGYALTRLVAHMEWALEDRPGVDDIVEYEARANRVFMIRSKDAII